MALGPRRWNLARKSRTHEDPTTRQHNYIIKKKVEVEGPRTKRRAPKFKLDFGK